MNTMVIKSLFTAVLAVSFGLAQAAYTNTFELEKLSQGQLIFDISYQNSNAKYDAESDQSGFNNGRMNERSTVLDLNLKVAATDRFYINLNLPLSDNLETDTTINGNTTTVEEFGMGDAKLTFQYAFSDDNNYGSVIAGIKLANAKSDSEAPGTGAQDYFLGLGYNLENTIFGVPAREELSFIYNMKGHKNSDTSGGDTMRLHGKSVFRLENIFRPILGLDIEYNTFSEDRSNEYQPTMETFISAGINIVPIKNFEIEALFTANLYSSIEQTTKSNGAVTNFNQNNLDSGFLIRFANKF